MGMSVFTQVVSSKFSQQLCKAGTVFPHFQMQKLNLKQKVTYLPKVGSDGAQVESRQPKARAIRDIQRNHLHCGETKETEDHRWEFTANTNTHFPPVILTPQVLMTANTSSKT